MKAPTVSVIIPNFNNAQFLSEAVGSVVGQTYSDIEIVVVDDGSTDNSLDVLQSFGDRITVIAKQNEGVSAARNDGVRTSSGSILAFLDSDDAWLPEKIEKQVEDLRRDQAVGLVHCGVVEVDVIGDRLDEQRNGMAGFVAEDILKYRRPVILGGGSAAMVTREAFDKAGGFDTRLQIGEDWEFYYRVARSFKVAFVNEILVKYRRHGQNSFADNPAAIERMEENMLAAYDRIFDADPSLRPLRRECYGKIHNVIAGSYFRVGKYGAFIDHSVRSLILSPRLITRFLAYPVRRGRRKKIAPIDQDR